jgi:hypothetical protein
MLGDPGNPLPLKRRVTPRERENIPKMRQNA